ncbi:MAG: site-2 protease family protein [Nocardioides sp.]
MSSSPARSAGTPGLISIGSVAGVPVRASVTTLVLVAVLAVALAPRIEQVRPGLGLGSYLVGAAIGLAVYAAVLAHELAHAVAAQRYGQEVESITLSLIGGRTAVDGEARSPREEFITAAVGPIVSLSLGASALGLRLLVGDGLTAIALEVIVLANLVLGLLDLVPAPPMDGGRLVKAAAWKLTGSPRRGSVLAAQVGQVVAVLVMVLTLVIAPLVQDGIPVSDMILGVALSLLLWAMATNELAVARLRLQVGELVVRDLVRRTLAVSGDLPLAEAVRRAQVADSPGLVTTDTVGRVVGVVSDAALADVPDERRPWVPTSEVTRPVGANHRLPADITGDELLTAIRKAPVAEYLLVDAAGLLVGVLALSDLDRAVRVR